MPFSILAEAALIIFIYMNIAFLVGMYLRDNSIVDVAWGLGFVCVVGILDYRYPDAQGVLLKYMISLWGLRLSIHLFFRYLKKGADWRYEAWKKEWGKWFVLRSYLQVYLLQGFFLWIIASLAYWGHGTDAPKDGQAIQYLGVLIFLMGFLFESVADEQLRRFKAQSSSSQSVMNQGLWRYSRHPNYFGEALLWWGMYLYVLPYAPVWAVISPITISWLLMRVSGVPMLEEKYKNNPSYQKYVKRTSAFFPWWPQDTA